MSRYRNQVAAALQAAVIRGPTRYVWLGRTSPPLPADLEAEMDDTARQSYLASRLTTELYSSFYSQGRPIPTRLGGPPPGTPDLRLATTLSEANAGCGGWERGWTLERVEDGAVVVATSRLRARIPTGDCDAPAGLRPGAAVSVRVPKELPSQSPGFYTAVGEAPADVEPPPAVVRAYWHVTRTGALQLMRALTERLNAAEVPFRLKVTDHPIRLLERCDAAVLYLPVGDFPVVREMLREVAAGLQGHLQPRIPAFTIGLASGVGLAEDDGGGDSFGMRRCTLLAEGILRAHAHGLTRVAARVAVVAERFAEAGIQIDAPYRDPSLSGRHVL